MLVSLSLIHQLLTFGVRHRRFDQRGRMVNCLGDMLFREQQLRGYSKGFHKTLKWFVRFHFRYNREGEAETIIIRFLQRAHKYQTLFLCYDGEPDLGLRWYLIAYVHLYFMSCLTFLREVVLVLREWRSFWVATSGFPNDWTCNSIVEFGNYRLGSDHFDTVIAKFTFKEKGGF